MATRASLAKEREHPIKDAKELYEWACLRKEDQLTKIFVIQLPKITKCCTRIRKAVLSGKNYSRNTKISFIYTHF